MPADSSNSEICTTIGRSPAVMPAVRTRDGQRVVFGRNERPPIGTANAASCAIPLLLRPVGIVRHPYIDGATHSPTNADLLVDAGVEVAIVSPRCHDALRRCDVGPTAPCGPRSRA